MLEVNCEVPFVHNKDLISSCFLHSYPSNYVGLPLNDDPKRSFLLDLILKDIQSEHNSTHIKYVLLNVDVRPPTSVVLKKKDNQFFLTSLSELWISFLWLENINILRYYSYWLKSFAKLKWLNKKISWISITMPWHDLLVFKEA